MTDVPRPALGTDQAALREAERAVAGLIDELQLGWERHDADITDRHLADDVLWGSPFGATVRGYDELHAIHRRLKQQSAGGSSSRFEALQILAPAPGVAVAQVRRVALDADGEPVPPSAELAGPFSEVALYVLVERDGTWWLTAGQNTPVRP